MRTAFDHGWANHHSRHDVMMLGGESVVVHRAGRGRPLVCIHGWAMGGLSFAPQLALVQHGFEVIALDLPGFGDSPVPLATPTIVGMAYLVRELITQLDLEGVTLIGWSMGASIAWQVAATDAAHVQALISIDMSPRVAPEEGWPFALSSGMTSETIDLAIQAMRADWPSYCDLFLDRILAEPNPATRTALAALAGQANPITASQAWLSLMQFDARDALSQIQCPARAIHGGRSVLYPQTVGHEIARLMPHCRAYVLDGVGHAPHIEAPDAFNAQILDLFVQGTANLELCHTHSAP